MHLLQRGGLAAARGRGDQQQPMVKPGNVFDLAQDALGERFRHDPFFHPRTGYAAPAACRAVIAAT